MRPSRTLKYCDGAELVCSYAVRALPAGEAAGAETHIASCPSCQRELASLRPVVHRFVFWPTDLLRPTKSLRGRLALRIADETGKQPVLPPPQPWPEPQWELVAPGVERKLLATDTERHRVCMLIRLAPGTRYRYRTHRYAGVEELLLVEGELWIDARKLVPGGYNRRATGAGDERVWSETGCTCFLATSTKNVLR